jgi:hypothetical protein
MTYPKYRTYLSYAKKSLSVNCQYSIHIEAAIEVRSLICLQRLLQCTKQLILAQFLGGYILLWNNSDRKELGGLLS